MEDYKISKEELERAATSWALDQIKDESQVGDAAMYFYLERLKFIIAYKEIEAQKD